MQTARAWFLVLAALLACWSVVYVAHAATKAPAVPLISDREQLAFFRDLATFNALVGDFKRAETALEAQKKRLIEKCGKDNDVRMDANSRIACVARPPQPKK